MHLRVHHLCAVLAIVLASTIAKPARGQARVDPRAKAPPRSAPRGEVRQASGAAPANVAPRGSAEQPPRGTANRSVDTAAARSNQALSPTVRAAAPKAPFTLSASHEKLLDQILIKWEKQSDKVKTFKCAFTRWEFDPAFGNPKADHLKSTGQGQIKYKSPDCGEYSIASLEEFDPATGVTRPKSEGLDHWMCDGKAIFEFNATKKQLIERRLPPEMQGKAISEGPLPFVFGAKADQLKRRYWMRDVTPKEEIGKSVWLEAFPKYQQDAANFQSATIILNESDFMPAALRIFMPGGKANTDYSFAGTKLNDPLAPVIEFVTPRITPVMFAKGWRHVVEEDPAAAQRRTPPPALEPAQAKRPAATSSRK